jgi:hypothetical protein
VCARQAIPSTFVGPLSKLQAIVSVVATEMSRAFEQGGFVLPPWRSHQALLSLWRTDKLEQLAAGLGSADLQQHQQQQHQQQPSRSAGGIATRPPRAPSPAATGRPTPFSALSAAPFAATDAGSSRLGRSAAAGAVADDASHQGGDNAKAALRQSLAPSAAHPPTHRNGKPLSMLAAAFNRGVALTAEPSSSRRTPSSDPFWSNITTVRLQGRPS